MSSFLRLFTTRLWGALTRRGARLDAEVRAHLDLLSEEHLRRGLTPAAARAAAQRDFGGIESMKDRYRDQRGVPFIDALIQDTRYALRSMRRTPMFTAVAVLTLAVGIGANTAMFSVADALVLRPLPVDRPDELRVVHYFISLGGRAEKSSTSLPYSMFQLLRTTPDVFTDVMAFSELDEIPISADRGEPSPSSLAFVTDNYFSMLGVAPRIGRSFTPATAGDVVISDGLWRRFFNAEPGALGRTLRIGSGTFNVVGVAPAEFTGVVIGRAPDVFLPLAALPAAQQGIVIAENSRFWSVRVIGRLVPDSAQGRPGTSDQAAGDRLTAIARANPLDPKAPPATIEVLPLDTGLSDVPARFLRPVQVLMAMVGMLLVIACANVALMLLSRNATRRAEIETRIAIGAGRARLVQQLMTEGAILACAAAAAGLVIAPWIARALIASLPTGLVPLSVQIAVDGRVLLFTAGVSLVAVLLAAAAPAVRTSGLERRLPLMRRTNTAGIDTRVSGSFVVAQVALAVTLLAGAGLLVQSLSALATLDLGFDASRVIQLNVSPESRGYTPPQFTDYYRDLVTRLEAVPGVEAVSYSQVGLLSGNRTTGTIDAPGFTPASDDDRWVQVFQVGPRFFETYGMTMRSGDGDFASGVRAAILNERAAKRFFGQTDPRGRQVRIGGEFEIIGVVGDARSNTLREAAEPTIYIPYGFTRPRGSLVIAVRARAVDAGMMSAVMREARAIDPIVPLRIVPLARVRDASLARDRLLAVVSSVFALAALVLLAIGLFGLLTFRVQQRTAEIGVRLALGATTRQVIWLVLYPPLRLAAVGLLAGLVLSLGATNFLQSLLFGLSPADLPTLAGSTIAVVVLVFLAGSVPAWSAARLEPAVALRQY
jgi:predicted permease